MIPSPRRIASQSAPSSSAWADLDDDDDDGWQDMPVVRSDDRGLDLDEEDQKKYHYRPPARIDGVNEAGPTGNATGVHLEVDADTLLSDSWREKLDQDESDYTRLRLDEDEEAEEVHMRTRYLFDDDKAMTPLSQMQATKELLTEGQRVAYVGLCYLIAQRMVRDTARGWEGVKLKGKQKEVVAKESATIWMMKIMARLYQHMELNRDEQRMIESLGEHGVDPTDLVPALMTTHTVKNPEFDPEAKRQADIAAAKAIEADAEAHASDSESEIDPPPPPYQAEENNSAIPARDVVMRKPPNPFGDDDNDEEKEREKEIGVKGKESSGAVSRSHRIPSVSVTDEDGGDIGSALSTPLPETPISEFPSGEGDVMDDSSEQTPKMGTSALPTEERSRDNVPMPSLPGVSTSLTTADETVTLDIRWTVLCDLFLVLIADSVYDSRSRAFLERVAIQLGFGFLDVVRFENRVTDALEIQESVGQLQQEQVIEGRKKSAQKKRYAMMGLAAVGGGLVIGLSAGLLAPIIGAGLGAAFATVGISGTTTFLAGAGGAAMITTGGVITGSSIATKGMARRTREVRTFEFKPLHNNKRVSCYITVGGFMASKVDDVRLPFSVLDSIVGDVFSVLWEPEMMAEMGNALKILTSEVLTQVGQQILQMTVMTALMSALQWPLILTKLGYLIDNPWSNALDRARAAGLVLADVLMQRHAGVRPTSLIGYSLGARVIFYALVELAKNKAFGIVQDVYLFGATVTASRQTWLDAQSVVGGRFLNGFATNDWMLGYLFRATSGGLNTVAGLRPIDTVPGVDNVDITELITGHMSYRSCMPQLLSHVGLPVTAEYFDEPEDPEIDMSIQERTIVNEAEEEAKQNRKKILGIFPTRKSTSRSASGTTTPDPNRKLSAGEAKIVSSSGPAGSDYDEGDDLPPREEADLGAMPSASQSTDSIDAEEAQLRAIPKTAGFDFAAISKELGKDIDVDKLRQPEPSRVPAVPSNLKPSLIERSGSAPPMESLAPATVADDENEPTVSIGRSASVSGLSTSPGSSLPPVDDVGDIAATANRALSLNLSAAAADLPSWERPTMDLTPSALSSFSSKISSTGGTGNRSSIFGFNAWSSSAASSISPSSASSLPTSSPLGGMPQRSAPPARPHPAELMANPFASSSSSSGSTTPLPAPEPTWGVGMSNASAPGANGKNDKLYENALANPW